MEQEKEIKKCANVLNTKMGTFSFPFMDSEKLKRKIAEKRQWGIWESTKALDTRMLEVEQRWHKKWEADREYFEKHGYHPDSRDVRS